MTWANGDTYEGEFENDFRNGNGTYTQASGDKYEGEFINKISFGLENICFFS